jgi:Domain of unknown function (DUF4902)
MRLSSEGLVHMSINELLSMPINHLVSGIDNGELAPAQACGQQTAISGHTEWVGEGDASITIGWDWCLESGGDRIALYRVGVPRTNVVLTDEDGRDRPWDTSLEHIASVVDALPWPRQVASVIGITLS